MKQELEGLPTHHATLKGFYQTGHKRLKTSAEVIDYRDPFAIPDLLERLSSGKYGSVTKDIEALIARRMQMLHPYFSKYPTLPNTFLEAEKNRSNEALKQATCTSDNNVIDLEDENVTNDVKAVAPSVVVIESDDEDNRLQEPFVPFREIVLPRPAGPFLMKDFLDYRVPLGNAKKGGAQREKASAELKIKREKVDELEIKGEKGVYVGIDDEDDHQTDAEDDGLEDMWKEMSMALECSKDDAEDPPSEEQVRGGGEDCDHSFVLKDDLGYVCRICGVIDRGIETIFEFQYNKVGVACVKMVAEQWIIYFYILSLQEQHAITSSAKWD